MPAGIITDTDVQLRIPGDLFRAVNPRTFSHPTITHVQQETVFGPASIVTAKVEGIPETFDLLFTIEDDPDDIARVVFAFNNDPIAGWNDLLHAFFVEQRRANAEKRALLDRDEAFLLDLEAGFLR